MSTPQAPRTAQRAQEPGVPASVAVTPASRHIIVSWKPGPGRADAFAILIGPSPDELRECKRLPHADGEQVAVLDGLTNGAPCYIAVISLQGETRSLMSEVWKVTPNTALYVRPGERARPAQRRKRDDIVASCAACNGDVALDENGTAYRCEDCKATYVQRVRDGAYLAVASLPNGICSCCLPRRPLLHPPGEPYRICSQTNERYVEIGGEQGVVRISQLEYGLCTCCNPPHTLALSRQGQVVCSAKRDHCYVRQGTRWVYQPPEAQASFLDDIDQALSGGNAIIGPNGVLMAGRSSGSRAGRHIRNEPGEPIPPREGGGTPGHD